MKSSLLYTYLDTLSHWKIMNRVRTITPFQAKRFAQHMKMPAKKASSLYAKKDPQYEAFQNYDMRSMQSYIAGEKAITTCSESTTERLLAKDPWSHHIGYSTKQETIRTLRNLLPRYLHFRMPEIEECDSHKNWTGGRNPWELKTSNYCSDVNGIAMNDAPVMEVWKKVLPLIQTEAEKSILSFMQAKKITTRQVARHFLSKEKGNRFPSSEKKQFLFFLNEDGTKVETPALTYPKYKNEDFCGDEEKKELTLVSICDPINPLASSVPFPDGPENPFFQCMWEKSSDGRAAQATSLITNHDFMIQYAYVFYFLPILAENIKEYFLSDRFLRD